MSDSQSANAHQQDDATPPSAKVLSLDAMRQNTANSDPSHIVGIGASAGGLEALETFFANMPPLNNMAFVVVQHLSPDFKSLMDQLLARHTEMRIERVEDEAKVKANTIYLIPPRKDMIIIRGALRLTDWSSSVRGVHLPIDTFFSSLAVEVGDRAIAIILSGTGSDGTRGIREIKEHGGLVLVQDLETARFDGMPRSAMATGVVDHVLPPAQMPQAMLKYTQYPLPLDEAMDTGEIALIQDKMDLVVSLLQQEQGIDFTHYKRSTLNRRTQRRMGIIGLSDIDEYIAQLQGSLQERQALVRDLLIHVTHFFRDPEAFAILERKVIPEIFQRTPEGRLIRVWVPACSTGEEVYSIAMLFREHLARESKQIGIKIFATDIDRRAVEIAAAGHYPESIVADVEPERIQRFFTQHRDGYQVNRPLREMIIFAAHDLLRDPPFTKMDLVSFRNCLIYFDQVIQPNVLGLLYHALNPKGYLFLGPSESCGEIADKFRTVHAKWKVFQKIRDVKLPLTPRLGLAPHLAVTDLPNRQSQATEARKDQRKGLPWQAFSKMVEQYSPPALVVNTRHEVLWYVGEVAPYLTRIKQASGRFSSNVLQLVPEELSMPLATALHKVMREKQDVIYNGLKVSIEKDNRRIRLRCTWIEAPEDESDQIVIYFEDMTASSQHIPVASQSMSEDMEEQTAQRLRDLEQDLAYTRENLQATIEELETSNEELQSSNEELMAANEELQSTNEELHSVNEELHTVNDEYQCKIQELTDLHTDIDNLLRSTDIGTIFLDRHLCIRKFTPAATAFLPLMEHDLGRPIHHFSHAFMDFDLVRDVETVILTGTRIEREHLTRSGTWTLLRILPFLCEDRTCAGIVLSCLDITARKQMELALATHVQQLEAVRAMASEITKELDPATLLDLIMHRAIERVDAATQGVIYLWDETDEVLRPRAWHNYGPWMQDVRMRLGEGLAGTVAQQREGLLVDHYQDFPNTYPLFMEKLGPLSSAVAEPLLFQDRLIGVIVLGRVRQNGDTATEPRFSSQDPALLALFARHAAVAIENARLFEAAQSQTDELAAANDALQREVQERTQAEVALGLAIAQLSDRNKELNEFTRAASHDLQEPLRHITMYSQLLQQRFGEELSDEVLECMQYITNGVDRMRAMVQDILKFSRLGRIDIQLERTALDKCVDTALHNLNFRIEAIGATIDREALHDIIGDRGMLIQLYQNLLGNALKFIGDRPPVIHLTATLQGDHWVCGVQDNGIGCDPSYAEQIFAPFQRLHSHSEYEGSGVGLAICRRIIERHGGRIWVESMPDQGSHFKFTLPRVTDESDS